MLIVGINGSPNMSGSTAFLLDQLSKEIELLNGEFKRINVVDALSDINTPFCTNCNNICDGRCYEGTKLEQSFQVMTKADAIVIASPVYFGSVSGQLKCFFDKTLKLRQERKLIGKIGAAIAVGGARYGGQENTIRTIQGILMIHGMSIISDGSITHGAGHFGIAAQEPAIEDKKAVKRIKILANRIAEEVLDLLN
ncbi:MAG: flavodoxin family protein [Tepidanaerobacteraceae bacterium]|nr:flavodoxin family protein [Thermoanaerobacterales bacterium]